MLLTDITEKLKMKHEYICNKSKNTIINVELDSRKADNSKIFVAIKGFKTDGHEFLKKAYENGCRNFIIEDEKFLIDEYKKDSTIIKTSDSREALAEISNIINDYPFNKLNMIGITGTKGKTSVSTLIHFFLSLSQKTCLFTTVKNIIGGKEYDSIRTTMEANELECMLKDALIHNEENAVVEVSSHAVTLKRVHGVEWNSGIFTSFSRDHLDLYGTMGKYFDAKLDFFRALNDSNKKNKFAVINADDAKGSEVLNILNDSVKKITVGTSDNCDYYIKNIEKNKINMKFRVIYNNEEIIIETKMRGFFNIINITLALACSAELGIKIADIKKNLLNFHGIDGRFDIIIREPFTVIVDYAHTPDSLKKILNEAGELSNGKLICVFGCTGERDVDKRSIMGEIAAELADYSYITNDDTYEEDPVKIAENVEQGFLNIKKNNYEIILDRKKAISKALKNAGHNDVVVIAGMGHEKVQILNGGTVPHNDKDWVLSVINAE